MCSKMTGDAEHDRSERIDAADAFSFPEASAHSVDMDLSM